MKDITNNIKRSIAQNVLWSIEGFFFKIQEIKDYGFEVSYWQDEESWATVVYEDLIVAYLWKKYPVIFVRKDIADKFWFLRSLDYLECIEVESFIQEDLEVIDEHLKYLFDGNINLSKFSVEGFWFYTNSI